MNRKHTIRVLLLTLTCLLLAGIGEVAQAQTAPKKEEPKSIFLVQPPLNREIKMDRKQFDSSTILIQETPQNDKALAYSVRLPKNWIKSLGATGGVGFDASKTRDVLSNIAEYKEPIEADKQSTFRVRAGTMPFAISAKDWFLNFVVTNNYTLQGLDVVNDKRIAAQYIYVDGGLQYIVRAVLEISGDRMVLGELLTPVEVWPDKRDTAKWAMVTFKLTAPDPAPAEPMAAHAFVDIAQFSYPKSWVLYAEPVSSIDRMTAILVNIRGGADGREIHSAKELSELVIDGRMDITSLVKRDSTTLATEMNNLKATLKGATFEIGDYLGEMKFNQSEGGVNKSIIQARTDAYKISSPVLKLVDYELWISVLETAGRYYIVQTLSIGRHNDFYAWSRNREALKIVTQSLEPVRK